MKLLFDENLSPKLTLSLSDIFPDSAHVHESGLGNMSDTLIWKYAGENGFTSVSKDSDFHARSVLKGHPPKLIWLRTGNCSSQDAAGLLRRNSVVIHTFEQSTSESFLILS